ncbi:hypothetical protein BDQ17DRAFT_1359687 [Cyathus striatus]|nr:hypothetical protein BDQ17DRAFT_1383534 [Cyathus striatus]KAF9000476.1 hypothetical protein BDQ17DRAFT_1359687 [Cyathus striatus]
MRPRFEARSLCARHSTSNLVLMLYFTICLRTSIAIAVLQIYIGVSKSMSLIRCYLPLGTGESSEAQAGPPDLTLTISPCT